MWSAHDIPSRWYVEAVAVGDALAAAEVAVARQVADQREEDDAIEAVYGPQFRSDH